MTRYRVRYSKNGPARYSSHLDMVRLFDRATRRANLPVAFSEGFNPHPKFSFAAPLPVGITGMDEYMDIELTDNIEPAELAARLRPNMQEGYEILDVKEIPERGPALMAMVSRASYRAVAKQTVDYSQAELCEAIQEVMGSTEILITRQVKGKNKEVDIRPGIFRLAGDITGHILEIDMELLIGSTGNVRPIEVLQRMYQSGKLPVNPGDFRIYRTALLADVAVGPISLWEV